MIDGYCNQPLRATVDTDTLYGPGDLRFQMQPNRTARLLLSRSPVTFVLGGQVSMAASFPAQYSQVPASMFKLANPLIGVYGASVPTGTDNAGQAVFLAPGYVGWHAGRAGYQVNVMYINGWPHGSLQKPVTKGDSLIRVDDCTGWYPPPGVTASGATGTLYDPSQTETFTVTSASAVAGPGILTLAAPLGYSHDVGIMASTVPSSVIQAAILYCTAQALTRGATATTAPAMGGGGGGGGGHEDLAGEAELLIHPYRRVI